MSRRFLNCLLAGVTMGGLALATLGPVAAQDAGGSSTSSATAATGSPTGIDGSSAASEPVAPNGGQAAQSAPAVSPSPTDSSSTAASPPVENAPTQAAATPSIPAPYLTSDAKLSLADIEAWLAAPRSVIEETPLVPERVSARVERLIGSDSRVVTPMVELALADGVTPEQRAMIVVGAARATRSAEVAAPEYAAYIQEVVARSGSESLISAYNVALQTSDIATASLGGTGPGGSSPSSGSLSGGGESGPAGAIGGDDVVPQTEPTLGSRNSSSLAVTDRGNDGGVAVRLVVCRVGSPVTLNCTTSN